MPPYPPPSTYITSHICIFFFSCSSSRCSQTSSLSTQQAIQLRIFPSPAHLLIQMLPNFLPFVTTRNIKYFLPLLIFQVLPNFPPFRHHTQHLCFFLPLLIIQMLPTPSLSTSHSTSVFFIPLPITQMLPDFPSFRHHTQHLFLLLFSAHNSSSPNTLPFDTTLSICVFSSPAHYPNAPNTAPFDTTLNICVYFFSLITTQVLPTPSLMRHHVYITYLLNFSAHDSDAPQPFLIWQ